MEIPDTITCYPEITDDFNVFLNRCQTAFTLRCINVQTDIEWRELLIMFIGNQSECHSFNADIQYAIVALNENHEIVSYVSFSAYGGEVKEFMPNLPESFPNEYYKCILFDFSCTSKKYVRRGLSVLLRLLIITFAIRADFDAVVSATNKESGALLTNKFGFQYNEELFFKDLYVTGGQLINARLPLKRGDEYLVKYKEQFEYLQSCIITK